MILGKCGNINFANISVIFPQKCLQKFAIEKIYDTFIYQHLGLKGVIHLPGGEEMGLVGHPQ